MSKRTSALLYIAGVGHCGSTLLDWLLGNHSSISAVSEVQALWLNPHDRRCTCGSLIAECPYWHRVRQVYAQFLNASPETVWEQYPITVVNSRTRRIPPNLFEVSLMLGSRALLKVLARIYGNAGEHIEMAENSWQLYDAIACADNTRWVVDASKNAIRMKVLYLTVPERFKVVHLVRDGRAVAASARRRLGISATQAARSWRSSVQAILLMLKTVPAKQQCLLRYEDLCDDPAGQLQDLCHFIGLPFEDQLDSLQFQIPHGVPGNRMAFDRPTRIVKDERWKTEMGEDDLQAFERIGGRLNRSLGYD